jgi:hypothetical protein
MPHTTIRYVLPRWDVAITFIFTLLFFIGIGVTCYLLNKKVESIDEEKRYYDRMVFTSVFVGIPLETHQCPTFDECEKSERMRRTRIAHVLLAQAQDILALQKILDNLNQHLQNAAYEPQIGLAHAVRIKYNERVFAFAESIHAADRFAHEDLYRDLGEWFDHYQRFDSWCLLVRRLNTLDLSYLHDNDYRNNACYN